MTRTLCSAVALVAVLGAPQLAEAQEPPPPPQPIEDLELATFREVFEYPAFTRRNPFAPLQGPGGGIRFEQLTLIGIMYSDDPAASVAIMSTANVTVEDDGTLNAGEGEAFNAKVGQQIGNVTIREIQRDLVVVDVEEFGLTDRRTMTFVSRRQGGSQ